MRTARDPLEAREARISDGRVSTRDQNPVEQRSVIDEHSPIIDPLLARGYVTNIPAA